MENEIINIVQTKIYTIRDMKVMIDSDLAELYTVETKRINEAVKNNPDKFPDDFYFELTNEEMEIFNSKSLRSKFSTLENSQKRGRHRKYSIKVFTEQGVYMLATINLSYIINTTWYITSYFII